MLQFVWITLPLDTAVFAFYLRACYRRFLFPRAYRASALCTRWMLFRAPPPLADVSFYRVLPAMNPTADGPAAHCWVHSACCVMGLLPFSPFLSTVLGFAWAVPANLPVSATILHGCHLHTLLPTVLCTPHTQAPTCVLPHVPAPYAFPARTHFPVSAGGIYYVPADCSDSLPATLCLQETYLRSLHTTALPATTARFYACLPPAFFLLPACLVVRSCVLHTFPCLFLSWLPVHTCMVLLTTVCAWFWVEWGYTPATACRSLWAFLLCCDVLPFLYYHCTTYTVPSPTVLLRYATATATGFSRASALPLLASCASPACTVHTLRSALPATHLGSAFFLLFIPYHACLWVLRSGDSYWMPACTPYARFTTALYHLLLQATCILYLLSHCRYHRYTHFLLLPLLVSPVPTVHYFTTPACLLPLPL